MSDKLTHGGEYCSNLVRTRDEDRWLAAQYAPDALKRALIALYAFHGELRRIPGAVTEPPLGEIRLQWWREALDEIVNAKAHRAHPVVEEMAATGIVSKPMMGLFEAAIDAAARPLYGEGFSDVDDLADWLEKAEGTVDALAVALAADNDATMRAVQKAGAAYSLAREGVGVAPNIAGEIPAKARDLWEDARGGLRDAPTDAAPAILHLSLTPGYLKHGVSPFPVSKRIRLFAAMAFGRF
ncbi:MAG: squalene/phytoene synthase family protein [Pseudomonadota bacterium]